MGHQLWIIEAPGKIKQLSEILKELNLDVKLFATKGHFFQMPEKLSELGIDSSFHDYERKPTDIKQVSRLREMAKEADIVVVATDADQEGDVIAWDVAEMLSDIDIKTTRIRLKGMDADSILEAINDRKPVLKEDAIPGRTRAIIDRMIGATFSKDGVAVGRVSTALLGLVASQPLSIKNMTLTALDKNGGRPWSASTEIISPLTDDIANKLVQLSFPPMSLEKSINKSYLPSHMGDIMVKAVDTLDLSPGETAKAMQRSYEIGKLSYPRAGSRGMSKAASLKIKKLLSKSYSFDENLVKEKNEEEVHDSPYPIGNVDVNLDPLKQGADEGIRTMIAKDLVKTGQKHTEQLPNTKRIVDFLRQNHFSEDVCHFIAQLHWYREEGPRFPGQEKWKKSQIIIRRNDGVLLEKAMNLGLGKPSTWGKHIDSFIEKKLVDENLQLTQKGKEWLSKSPKALLDVKISAAIEKACELKKISINTPDAEPWEVLAKKIFNALPEEIKKPVVDSVKDIKQQPRLNYRELADSLIVKPSIQKKDDYIPPVPIPPST